MEEKVKCAMGRMVHALILHFFFASRLSERLGITTEEAEERMKNDPAIQDELKNYYIEGTSEVR